MSASLPALPSVPSETSFLQQANYSGSYYPGTSGARSCADNLQNKFPTYVTVLVDMVAQSIDGPEVDRICQPLLVAKKGDKIEVVDRYAHDVWVGVVGTRQGAFRLNAVVS